MTVTSRQCSACGVSIPLERLQALPNTQYCTAHSRAVVPLALMVYSHKTAGELVVVNREGPGGAENVRQALNAHRRKR